MSSCRMASVFSAVGLRVPCHPFKNGINCSNTIKREVMESSGHGKVNQHRINWLTRCEAIAESDSFVRRGHAEDQVRLLKTTLLPAAVERVNWREIYRSIYDQWHTEHPHFSGLNTMAAEINQYRSRSNRTKSRSFLPGRV